MRTLPPLLVLLFACAPSDAESTLVNTTVEIPPGKFSIFQIRIEKPTDYTLTVTPEGGEVDIWLHEGPQIKLAFAGENPPQGGARVPSGTTGTCSKRMVDYSAPAAANVMNRGSAPVKAKVLLVSKPVPKAP